MKKLPFLLATLSVIGVAGLSGSSAHALDGAATCAIGFTGPDSKNICTSETKYNCMLKDDNTIVFLNDNQQVAVSGDAKVISNTDGGSSTTGSSTNTSGVTYTGTVTNDNKVCTAVVTMPATVTPAEVQPVTPVAAPAASQPAPGRGAVAAPAALPNTAANSPLVTTLALTGGAGILLLLTRMAVLAYGNRGA